VYLPAWPLQRLFGRRPELRDKPLVLVNASGLRGPQVVLSSVPRRGRSRAGCVIPPGTPLAEAVSIQSDLQVEPHDPRRDRESLERLAAWASRFSPAVAIEDAAAPQSLLLDVTGCAALFRGEPNLLRQVLREFGAIGLQARVALADTVGAAWALAHFGDACTLVPAGRGERAVAPLPIAALRLPPETIEALRALGVVRVRDLAALPRSSLPARFGPAVIERLDQALGRTPELLVPHRPLPGVEAAITFEYATDRRDVLHCAVRQLTEQVGEMLRERSAGAKQLVCLLHHDVTKPTAIEVSLYRSSRSPRHLEMLLGTRLERVEVVEPVAAVTLRVARTAPLDDGQAELFETERTAGAEPIGKLIDQLCSRLGRDAVTRPELVPDAQPEFACRFEPAIGDSPEQKVSGTFSLRRVAGVESSSPQTKLRGEKVPDTFSDTLTFTASRPLRLWPEPLPVLVMSVVPDGPPVRFRWLHVEHRVASAWGPERIDTGWWRGDDVRRDYYVVETTDGARFWLFRRRDDGHWFLHGCFD